METVIEVQDITNLAQELPNEGRAQLYDFMKELKERYKTSTEVDTSKRIGIAKGQFKAPDDFDACNEEVYAMLRDLSETPL